MEIVMNVYRIVMYKNEKIVDFKNKNMKLYEDFIFDVDNFRFFYIKRDSEVVNNDSLISELLNLEVSKCKNGNDVILWKDFLSYMFKESYDRFNGDDYVNLKSFYGNYYEEENVFYVDLNFYEEVDEEEEDGEILEYYDKVMEEFFVNRKWKFFIDECIN